MSDPTGTNCLLFRKFLSPLISSEIFSLSSSLCSLFISLLFGIFFSQIGVPADSPPKTHPKNQSFFFFFSQMGTGRTSPPPNPPHGHGLKEMPPPRRREPPQPAAVACRARSLPVWRSPTAKPAAWGLPCPISAGWSPE